MTQDIRPNLLKATNEDTSGPYFPIYFQDESLEDLTVLGPGIVGGPRGQHIILSGRVLDRHGDLANGVLMEFWQANSKGIFNSPTHAGHSDLDPWFNGYATPLLTQRIQTLILGSTATAGYAAPAESISFVPSCQERPTNAHQTSLLLCFPTELAALLRRFSLRVRKLTKLTLCCSLWTVRIRRV